MEANSVLHALTEAISAVRLAGAPVRHLNNVIRSFERLPVEVDAAYGK
jgi:hypothetical protein